MKSLRITEREIELIKRGFEYSCERLLNKFGNESVFDDDFNDFIIIKNHSLRITVYSSQDEDKSEYDFDFSFDFFIEKKMFGKYYIMGNFQIHKEDINKQNILDELNKTLETLSPIKICECNEKITHSEFDKCFECYTYNTYMVDKCPICLENGEGVWVKNGCNCKFYYHNKCLNECSNCPTCRKVIIKIEYF